MKIRISDKAKRVVGAVAPALGAALGGPLGGLAGNVLSAALGGKDVDTALMEQSPETMIALARAEQDFLIKLDELGVERERIGMADRVSARELARVNMRPQLWISGLFLGGYFAVLVGRMTGVLQVDEADQQTLNTLFGALTTGVPLVLSFWFGSTAGSAIKSELLAKSRPD